MSDYPQVHAAFINAIREEGTKAQACHFLQEQWNKNCAMVAEIKLLREALEYCARDDGTHYENRKTVAIDALRRSSSIAGVIQ